MHDRISVNAICFAGSGLPELAQAWRALDCRRISMVSAPVLAAGAAGVRAALGDELQIETINHNFVLGPLQADPANWPAPRDRLSRLIVEAKALNARSIYMLTGGHGALEWDAAARAFSDALAPCVEQAEAAGIALMLENAPPLYSDIHIAHSLADAAELAEAAGIGVCVELFGCWNEAGLKASLARVMPRCRLIQVSDYIYGDRAYPCRAVPGDGAIPLKRLIGWALEAGYEGSFDLELIGPRIEREGHLAAARRAADQLGELLILLGA